MKTNVAEEEVDSCRYCWSQQTNKSSTLNYYIYGYCRGFGKFLNDVTIVKFLRPEDCKYRELIFKTEITDFFIFCQEKSFGKLFSKISLKLARVLLV